MSRSWILVLGCAVALGTRLIGHAPAQGPRPAPKPPRMTTLREFFPLAHAQYFGDAEFILANFGPEDNAITPTWLIRGRDPITAAAILVPRTDVRFLKLRDLLPADVSLIDLDGLFFSYTGRAVMQMPAQVVLLPTPGSTMKAPLDVPPTIPVDASGPHLEAVWSRQSGARAAVVVVNLADDPQDIVATTSAGVQRFALENGDAHIVQVPAGDGGVDWMRIDGRIDGVRASGFVLSTDGQPRLVRFYNPQAPTWPDLWANDVDMSAGAAAVKNTRDVSTRLQPTLFDTNGHPLADLPAIDLAPRAAAAIPLPQNSPSHATLRVRVFAPPGSVIGSALRLDRTTGRVVDAPLRDAGRDDTSYRRQTGNCAWRLDGDFNTVIRITNVGDGPVSLLFGLRFLGGDYNVGPESLDIGQTKVIDLRGIRDAQVLNGRRGHPLPMSAQHGTCHWSAVGTPQTGSPSNARLMGEATITSRSRGYFSSHTW